MACLFKVACAALLYTILYGAEAFNPISAELWTISILAPNTVQTPLVHWALQLSPACTAKHVCSYAPARILSHTLAA